MVERLIIVTEIDDEDRDAIVWHILENQRPELTTEHCCEIDTTTWDLDAWREWRQQLEMIEDAMDVDEIIIIWRLAGGDVDRSGFGLRT